MIILWLPVLLAGALALSTLGAFAWLEGRVNISGYAIFLSAGLWLLWALAIVWVVLLWHRAGLTRVAWRQAAALAILLIPLALVPFAGRASEAYFCGFAAWARHHITSRALLTGLHAASATAREDPVPTWWPGLDVDVMGTSIPVGARTGAVLRADPDDARYIMHGECLCLSWRSVSPFGYVRFVLVGSELRRCEDLFSNGRLEWRQIEPSVTIGILHLP